MYRIGSVVLATLSWLLLATFPGWHSEIDHDGEDIDVKPFPNRTVMSITVGSTTLAMLFAFVSAVWQHTSTATTSTLLRASIFGLQSKTGPIGTTMVWINLCLLLIATLMMVIMILALRAVNNIVDPEDEKIIIEDENMMSGAIKGKNRTPIIIVDEGKTRKFSYTRNFPMNMPPPPPPPDWITSMPPPPPPPGFKRKSPLRTEIQTEYMPSQSYSTIPAQSVVDHSVSSVRHQTQGQTVQGPAAQGPAVQDFAVHVPVQNAASDLTDRRRQDTETPKTASSKPDTTQIHAIEAEIEELEAKKASLLRTRELRASKQSISSDETQVKVRQPILLPPSTPSVQTIETRQGRDSDTGQVTEPNPLKQTNTAPSSSVKPTTLQLQESQSAPVHHHPNDTQATRASETRPNQTSDDLYNLSG